MSIKALFRRPAAIILMLLVILCTLPACGSRSNPSADQSSPQPAIEFSTPTPLPPDRVVLVPAADTNPDVLKEAQTMLSELSSASALEFEVRQEISHETLSPDIKVLVFLYHPENLGSLAAAAPSTQFVALSSQDWNPPANVTIIRTREYDAAFLSGYVSVLLAPNFRVGALLSAEQPQVGQAFQNGVLYYCGLCASALMPLNAYPLVSVQSAASPVETWQAAFNELNLSKINVLFLTPEAASPQLLSYLSAQDVALVGMQSPPAEGSSRWAATIGADNLTPIREIWSDLLSGSGGRIINAGIKLGDLQPINVQDGLVWLSPGKQILVEKITQLLREDQIYPLPL